MTENAPIDRGIQNVWAWAAASLAYARRAADVQVCELTDNGVISVLSTAQHAQQHNQDETAGSAIASGCGTWVGREGWSVNKIYFVGLLHGVCSVHGIRTVAGSLVPPSYIHGEGTGRGHRMASGIASKRGRTRRTGESRLCSP